MEKLYSFLLHKSGWRLAGMFFKCIVKGRFGFETNGLANGLHGKMLEFGVQQSLLGQCNPFLVDVVIEVYSCFGIDQFGNGIAIGFQFFRYLFKCHILLGIIL